MIKRSWTRHEDAFFAITNRNRRFQGLGAVAMNVLGVGCVIVLALAFAAPMFDHLSATLTGLMH
jgi:hypothetical protein